MMATQTQQQPPATQSMPGGKAGGYLGEVQKEMRKVNWPGRTELINNTVLTLVFALFLGSLIFLSDQAISKLLALIYG